MCRLRLVLALGFILATGLYAAAQPASPPPSSPAPVSTAAPEIRIAPGGFDPAAATEAYLARLTPEQKTRSDAYFEGGYWLRLWDLLYSLGVAWLLLGTGLSGRLRDAIERHTRRRPIQIWQYGVSYVLLVAVLSFPLAVYEDFWREHQYGLATQTFGPWLKDRLVALGVMLVIVPLLLMPLYRVLRGAPRTWWAWGAAISTAFFVIGVLIGPVYVDPLFNRYAPLAPGPVKDEILSLSRASGIEASDVFQFDASRQTTRVSANVSGMLGTLRIRLNDNLLNRCTLPEIKAVMAHEMGHYALNHVYELILSFGLVLLVGFAFLHGTFERVRSRWGAGWHIADVGDIAGLPLLAALLSTYLFALTPVLNTIVRTNEAEADLFGLHAAREPEGFAEAALKLGEYRKLDPGRVEEWLFFDHPSGRSRIRMAMEWKAEAVRRAGTVTPARSQP